jgi:hypothetical protein
LNISSETSLSTVILQVVIFGQMDMTKAKGAVLQLYSKDVPNGE